VAFASSLDQAGPIARTVRDAALLMRSMAGTIPKDTTSVDLPGARLRGGARPLGEGHAHRHPEGISASTACRARSRRCGSQGIAWLKDAGAEMVDVSLPHTKYALPAYYIVAPAEASSNLARYDGVRYGLRVPGRDITDCTRARARKASARRCAGRVMIGTYVLSAGYYEAYYIRAQKVRTLIKRDFEIASRRHRRDAHAGDAVGGVRDRREGRADPVEMYLNDVFTVTVNMAGLPASRCRRDSTRRACRSGCS
jgi:aspartyl-tRNA(Asn)/glutamyl-tRNA(Gln) amidotransferase subunit A